MLRKSRIDAPGALHHIIVRGIDRQKIFENDEDRDHFLSRLGIILTETKPDCYAWALIPNHFHLLLRTGNVSIATAMRRLLTGYALCITADIADMVICFRTDTNLFYARRMPTCWNWFGTSISIR